MGTVIDFTQAKIRSAVGEQREKRSYNTRPWEVQKSTRRSKGVVHQKNLQKANCLLWERGFPKNMNKNFPWNYMQSLHWHKWMSEWIKRIVSASEMGCELSQEFQGSWMKQDMTGYGRHQWLAGSAGYSSWPCILCKVTFTPRPKVERVNNSHEPTETDSGRLMLTGGIPIGPGMRSLQASWRLFWCGSPDTQRLQPETGLTVLVTWSIGFFGFTK